MKHTPGPWKSDGFGMSVWGERPAGATVQPHICKVIYGGMDDARLIAAAPEMYEVCKAIADLSDGQGRLNMCEVAGWARQVLAKAEGVQP